MFFDAFKQFFFSIVLLRQGLVELGLAWDSLCSWEWPLTPKCLHSPSTRIMGKCCQGCKQVYPSESIERDCFQEFRLIESTPQWLNLGFNLRTNNFGNELVHIYIISFPPWSHLVFSFQREYLFNSHFYSHCSLFSLKYSHPIISIFSSSRLLYCSLTYKFIIYWKYLNLQAS